DVPRAPETQRTFESMARMAASIAGELDGSIVDDNDKLLDERALEAIGGQLEKVRAELAARGFAPGGALALRLFS
ncbi:MAG: cell division protein ZipA C-terminal FtsZ-binding domain-containing protein, partial [Burkholderiales bacterium]